MKKLLGIAAIAALAGAAHGQVVISEILGSTSSTDVEYIELVNLGGAPVDISGWAIELWDSNDDPGISATPNGGWGALDGGSPHVISGGTIIAPGGTFVLGNQYVLGSVFPSVQGDFAAPFPTTYGGQAFASDQLLPDNSIENSSYTAILVDAGSTPIDSWFVLDDPANDTANRGGVPFAPNFTVGPDGSFLPAGGYRVGGAIGGFLNFTRAGGTAPTLNDGTLAGGTPGINQIIPAPGAFAFAGIGGLLAIRRRR